MSGTNVFTIGCSIQSIEAFIVLLQKNGITALADVRSVPYSKFTPQFNKENIQEDLMRAGIIYIPMSDEFGARRKELDAYTNHQVDFTKTARLPKFLAGIRRIDTGLKKGFRIALMCAEKDPLDCHRFILVSRNIQKMLDVEVKHIHIDGSVEDTCMIEKRMIKKVTLETPLFENQDAAFTEKVYKMLENKIAYRKEG